MTQSIIMMRHLVIMFYLSMSVHANRSLKDTAVNGSLSHLNPNDNWDSTSDFSMGNVSDDSFNETLIITDEDWLRQPSPYDLFDSTSNLGMDNATDGSGNDRMLVSYKDWLGRPIYSDLMNATYLNDTSMYDNETVLFTFTTPNKTLMFNSAYTIPYDLPSRVHHLRYEGDIYSALKWSTRESGQIELVLPILAVTSFCPSMHSCNVQTHGNGYEENHCCVRCEVCDDKCASMMMCCIDIFRIYDGGATCEELTIGDSTMRAGTFGAMLHSACRIGVDEKIVQKCQSTLYGSVNEIIPVYSNISNIVYKNNYCFQCNEIVTEQEFTIQSGIKPLEARLICKSPTLWIQLLKNIFENPGKPTNKLLTMVGCFIQWHTDLNVEKCMTENQIQECYDPSFENIQIRNLCKTIYAPVRGKMGLYINMYCLICNEGYEMYNESCKTDFEDVHESLYDIQEHRYRVMLQLSEVIVGIIDGNILDLQQTSGINEIMDNDQVCSVTSLKIGSLCIPVINGVMGIGFDYLFRIVYSNNLTMSNKEIFEIVRPLILGKNEVPNLCVERILNKYEDGKNTITLVQLTKMNIRLTNLRSEYSSLKNKIETMYGVKGHNTTISVEIYQSPLELIEDGPVSFAVYSNVSVSNECGRAVAMTNLQFCDTCLLTKVIRLDDASIIANGVKYIAGEYMFVSQSGSNSSILVCCELHHKKMVVGLTGALNAAVSLSVSNGYFIVITLSLGYLGLLKGHTIIIVEL